MKVVRAIKLFFQEGRPPSRRCLASLLATCACLQPPVPDPSTPNSTSVDAEPAPEVERPFPPVSEILFEQHLFSLQFTFSPASVLGSFPLVTIYTDGTMLRMKLVESGLGLELVEARLSPEQLAELRERLASLAPYDRVEQTVGTCELDPDPMLASEYRFSSTYRIRVEDDRWICYRGCPIAPIEFEAEFLDLLRFVETFAELEQQPWQSTRGHVVVLPRKAGPAGLPWSNESLRDDWPHAWVLDEEAFAIALKLAGGLLGHREVTIGDRKHAISVVPWRPGEDASAAVDIINANRPELIDSFGCDDDEELPPPIWQPAKRVPSDP